MAGVNSLGIGSGVLTSDLLDKLREADNASIIKPLENKVTLANQKDDAYALLSTLMTTFKSSTSALDGDTLYLARAVTGNTDAVTVKAEAGSNVQSFNITNVSKAEKDVWNSLAFASTSTAMTDLGAGTFSVSIGTDTFDIAYTAASSLDDIKNSINELAGTKMTASVLQVGDASYELVITADDVNQAITFSDSNVAGDPLAKSLISTLGLDEQDLTDPLNPVFTHNIQVAKSATFNYNGIEITRSTNEISDLIVGVTISLNQNQAAEDNATINIAQNNTSISSEISLFVNGYNSLMTNLNDMTRSDRESGSVGIFNGESFVKSISRTITDMITQLDSNRNSLVDFGIDIDRDGVMSLDNDVFANKFVTDPQGMELFFSGNSETDGVFTKLNAQMDNYMGYNKLMANFSDQLTTAKDNLVEQYDRQKAMLDDRYAIMAKKFSAYDVMISRLNTQFSSMQMMIDAQANTKNN
ncbi:MAG: hypothetical protein AUK54_08920 [Helicobacteraceae bacterium CG2_30_36_10]|nr:MAG: hypothetical protein AUK54_08920 [Helicobacteraceae bacterium CG2_30_36_10]